MTPLPELGQFYTKRVAAALLTALPRAPSLGGDSLKIADLASGHGALAAAARHRWPEADITTVDIDPRAAAVLAGRLGSLTWRHFTLDATRTDLAQRIGTGYDLVFCNPPFGTKPDHGPHARLLADAGLAAPDGTRVGIEALFVAQSLQLLREGGQAALVMPDSVITGARYGWLRKALTAHHVVDATVAPRRGVIPAGAKDLGPVLN